MLQNWLRYDSWVFGCLTVSPVPYWQIFYKLWNLKEIHFYPGSHHYCTYNLFFPSLQTVEEIHFYPDVFLRKNMSWCLFIYLYIIYFIPLSILKYPTFQDGRNTRLPMSTELYLRVWFSQLLWVIPHEVHHAPLLIRNFLLSHPRFGCMVSYSIPSFQIQTSSSWGYYSKAVHSPRRRIDRRKI